MAKPEDFTVEQWVEELTRLSARRGEDGLSTQEIAESVGRSVVWVRERILATAKRLGVLRVGRRRGENVAGLPVDIPVYRFVKGGKS